MKEIWIYDNGNVAVMDDESPNSVSLSGKVVEKVEYNEENMKKYFGDIPEPEIKVL